MQMLQIFIFFSNLVDDPKYYLPVVDFFTSKIYTYPMKNKNLLAKKLEIFYQEIDPKRKQIMLEDKMRLQKDLEFNQNKIKQLTKI